MFICLLIFYKIFKLRTAFIKLDFKSKKYVIIMSQEGL